MVGDILKIHAGDVMPADGILIRAFEVIVDESIMTGEINPISK